jgi:molybdopterin converting factor small subunit
VLLKSAVLIWRANAQWTNRKIAARRRGHQDLRDTVEKSRSRLSQLHSGVDVAERRERLVRASITELRQEMNKLFVTGDEVTLRGPALREYERAREVAKSMGMEIDEALLQLRKLDAAAHNQGVAVEQAA